MSKHMQLFYKVTGSVFDGATDAALAADMESCTAIKELIEDTPDLGNIVIDFNCGEDKEL